MLYNPNWSPAPAYTLAGLIAWLETQDPATEYDWTACNDCLVGRFIAAHNGGRIPWGELGQEVPHLHEIINGIGSINGPYGRICATQPWTYGAALARARAL